MSDIIETIEVGDWRVNICQDYDCASPRENCNLGVMVTWSRDYLSPDSNKAWYDLENFEEWYQDQDFLDERWVRLPLIPKYYDGGYNTGSDQDILEGRHCGWIFTTAETVDETGAPLESLVDQLKAEVEEYNLWANGQTYGYVIERREVCECCQNVTWVDEGSCWGFIGRIWEIDFPSSAPDELKAETLDSDYVEYVS